MVVEDTLEDGQVDVLAIHVVVAALATFVAGFDNDIDFAPHWVEQVEEQIEDAFS